MKKLSKKSHFYNETFSMNYHFFQSKDDWNNISKWVNCDDVVGDGIDGRCLQLTNNGSVRIFIGMFNDKMDTLAHECLHAALFTFEAIGQKLDYEDEALPYLLSYIFRECEKKIDINKK